VPIIENGRRKLIRASVAIDKQLTLRAASGNLRAIIDIKEQLSFLETLMKSKDIERKFPEDVTEEFMALTRNLRLSIDPDYLP
jgi:hypothetical protein